MIDVAYANLVSSRLEKFKQIRNGVYTFRCPYCGDSEKYRNKTRGYFFAKKSGLVFKCHNCGVGRSFGNFLKENANDLHDEYIMERYKQGLTGKGRNVADPEFKFSKPKFVKKQTSLPTIESLNSDHPAQGYLLGRGIPESKFSDLYYAEKFCKWTNDQKPTFKNVKKDHPRIIIPFIDKEGNWFGYQGRSLDATDKMRYLTIMLDEDRPKIYGLNKIDDTKTVFITEGPFDSFFVPNSVAMCGADVDVSSYNWDCVYIFDNEPRNIQICDRISNTIDNGDKVVIWPINLDQKDLNDMILAGHDIRNLVESNVYQGLEAKVKFTEWKRV
ncbi:DNA primase subunit [Synechococcus phage S-MbCM6]|uniref:DNA primase subunit n=3 Tax=Namakavirus smbcm6 TaxID=2734120 RepID=H8ZMT5_9CAUD|nr:DNA primase [Synechococcus phage ACG-2014c]AHB80806.1 DNA primase subunit [Synechococcus phage S-MbCM25]AFD02796.1 gp61 DNA primase subunit [Synechococcus phage ACG-2014c]AIX14567.1 DNA primase subunit [Synechococcus phage ACG-2014c]AIX22724.1 DNA primase subunit [Synechococcus phage ACG-2014c]AIX22939.1 DNA primase subunit [Synechococcus phage ACG-2014c]